MNTDTRRAAAARLQATRKAAGWTKRTTWLDPASSAKLEAMKAQLGSYDEAIRQAVMGWGERDHLVTEARVTYAPGHPKITRSLAKPLAAASAKLREAIANPPHIDVQIGPVEPKPGSRLKKGKT